MFMDYLRTSGHKTPFFYLSRFSPGMLLFSRRRSSLLQLYFLISECNSSFLSTLCLTLTNFPLFPLPVSIYTILFPPLTMFTSLAKSTIYRETRLYIRPGNRLGFVKVEYTGENRSSPYKKGRNEGEALGAPRGLAFLPQPLYLST